MRNALVIAALLVTTLTGCRKDPRVVECEQVRREVAAAKVEGLQRAVREARQSGVHDEAQLWATLDAARARLRKLRLTDPTLRALVIDYDKAESRLYTALQRDLDEPPEAYDEDMWADYTGMLTDYKRSIDAMTAYCAW